MYTFLPSHIPLPSSRIWFISVGCPSSGSAPYSPVQTAQDTVSYSFSETTFLFFPSWQEEDLLQCPHRAPSNRHRFHPVPSLPILLSSFLYLQPSTGTESRSWSDSEGKGWRWCIFLLPCLSSCSQCCQGSRDKTQRKWGQGKHASKKWLPLAAASQICI